MKLKKVLCTIMACFSAFSLMACGGGNSGDGTNGNGGNGGVDGELVNLTESDYYNWRHNTVNPRPSNSNYSTINVQIYPGGNGEQWLYNAATRFQKRYANYSFEEGKKGVYINIAGQEIDMTTVNTSAVHVFFAERFSNVYSLAEQEYILPLDDVIKATDYENEATIESRIFDAAKAGLKGPDGKYYALPNDELYPGLSYDKDIFGRQRWYLAKDATSGTKIDTKYGSAYFVKDANAEKSCGPDAVYGTYDDGLPSSLEELLIVCGKIKSDGGIVLSMSGQWSQYTNYLIQGLWASLAGIEELRALYTFEGDVEVVTGYTSQNLFTGINYIQKPTTETVAITQDNAYLAYKSVARYYATSFIEIAYKEGWFSAEAVGSTGDTDILDVFITDAPSGNSPRAFLIEGSYWYNKLNDDLPSSMELYQDLTGEEYPNVAFMSLPGELKTADVTIGQKRAQALFDNGLSCVYVNAKYKDTEILDACKTFLKFLYSDRELRAYTECAGTLRPMEYELTSSEYEKMSTYYKSLYDLSRDSEVLYLSSENEAFNKNRFTLRIHFSCNFFGVSGYSNCFEAFRKTSGTTAKTVFEGSAYTADYWAGTILGK